MLTFRLNAEVQDRHDKLMQDLEKINRDIRLKRQNGFSSVIYAIRLKKVKTNYEKKLSDAFDCLISMLHHNEVDFGDVDYFLDMVDGIVDLDEVCERVDKGTWNGEIPYTRISAEEIQRKPVVRLVSAIRPDAGFRPNDQQVKTEKTPVIVSNVLPIRRVEKQEPVKPAVKVAPNSVTSLALELVLLTELRFKDKLAKMIASGEIFKRFAHKELHPAVLKLLEIHTKRTQQVKKS